MKSKKQSSFNQNEAVKSVLVGTFRNENAEWIKEKKLYNLPLPQCGKVAFHENISRVVLIADGFKSVVYEARFREVVDDTWLKENGYKVAIENIEVPFKAPEKRPPLVDKNDVLKSIKFDESWIGVVK
jgi:hypothetical protein